MIIFQFVLSDCFCDFDLILGWGFCTFLTPSCKLILGWKDYVPRKAANQ